ncbi:unnamed protein product [Blumeria hordei]|uniref:N(6)-L-threonylcarbamoyladenine synthase n=1 Tax=Blumeria hordei TaxID=2867405 RepID=A0A383UT47_BLUHO|nr:unnamed protein product [Blumeria hordei]
MKQFSLFIRPRLPPKSFKWRSLITVAIETSCDDTSVAVLEKHANRSVQLHYHTKITSDNRCFGGVHPIAAHESHQFNLAQLVQQAIESLPLANAEDKSAGRAAIYGTRLLKKPDFVTVTRGPGMRASLITGLDTAKGLSVAWQVPLLGVNHMQAHALTPHLVSALNASLSGTDEAVQPTPAFPFLTLLVSGGHTMLVHTRSPWEHKILANTTDLSIGDMLDKSARVILPTSQISASSDVMYGRLLEEFAYPCLSPGYEYVPPKTSIKARSGEHHGYNWTITPPYISPGPEGPLKYADSFSFSGMGSKARSTMAQNPNMSIAERRCLAQILMTVAFEHLASRILFALDQQELCDISALVVSGGVASNQFLQTVLRRLLNARSFQHIQLVVPPPNLCTDNAAMIAWTGMEMFEAGWTTQLCASSLRQWSIDSNSSDGGILGANNWLYNGCNHKQ